MGDGPMSDRKLVPIRPQSLAVPELCELSDEKKAAILRRDAVERPASRFAELMRRASELPKAEDVPVNQITTMLAQLAELVEPMKAMARSRIDRKYAAGVATVLLNDLGRREATGLALAIRHLISAERDELGREMQPIAWEVAAASVLRVARTGIKIWQAGDFLKPCEDIRNYLQCALGEARYEESAYHRLLADCDTGCSPKPVIVRDGSDWRVLDGAHGYGYRSKEQAEAYVARRQARTR
jgi:hypothetical protein